MQEDERESDSHSESKFDSTYIQCPYSFFLKKKKNEMAMTVKVTVLLKQIKVHRI